MITIGVIAGLLAGFWGGVLVGFWGGVLVERSRWVIAGVDDFLAPFVAAREVQAWDDGFDAGHQAARSVNREWPEMPRNPYRDVVGDD